MKRSTIALVAVAACLGFVAAQLEDQTYDQDNEFEYGYDAYYDEYNYGNWYNEDYDEEVLNYYDGGYGDYGEYDPYAQYEYGYGYDALYDYPEDYYMDYDYFDQAPDCEVDEKGKVVFQGLEACDLKISGADKVLDKLEGGMDGVYEVNGCHDGRPLYQRKGKGPKRLLWYSALYKDWDFNEGEAVVESDILGYGGDGIAEERPQFVPKEKWNLLAEYSSSNTDELKDFVAVTLKMQCADGKTVIEPRDGSHPDAPAKPVTLLTDEEWEDRYAKIYKKFQKKQEPRINTLFVAFIVLSGIGIVLGIPYMVFFKKGKKSKAYSLLNQSRKQMAGKL